MLEIVCHLTNLPILLSPQNPADYSIMTSDYLHLPAAYTLKRKSNFNHIIYAFRITC